MYERQKKKVRRKVYVLVSLVAAEASAPYGKKYTQDVCGNISWVYAVYFSWKILYVV